MKALLLLAVLATPLMAQTTAAPPPQPFTWAAPVASATQLGCPVTPSSAACAYRLFRANGACPASLPAWPTNSSGAPPAGWTQILVTALSQTTAVDATTAYATTYAYVVTSQNPTTTTQSQPSNCLTVTTVAPPPPTILGAPTGLTQP